MAATTVYRVTYQWSTGHSKYETFTDLVASATGTQADIESVVKGVKNHSGSITILSLIVVLQNVLA